MAKRKETPEKTPQRIEDSVVREMKKSPVLQLPVMLKFSYPTSLTINQLVDMAAVSGCSVEIRFTKRPKETIE